MKKSKVWWILFLLVFWANGLFAQSRTFAYELKKQDYLILPLSFGVSVLGGTVSTQNSSITFNEIAALDRDDINGFDRSATHNWSPEWAERSDLYRNYVVWPATFILSIPPLFHARLSETATVGVMFLETYFIIAGVTYFTKAATGRKRPYVYNTDLSVEERHTIGSDDVYFSFFSGHTAAAFCAATFLSKVMNDIHGISIWTRLLWGSSLTLAALTGYARVKAGKHYPSDVIAGAVVGLAIGYLVPTLHKKKNRDSLSLLIAPNRIGLCLKL